MSSSAPQSSQPRSKSETAPTTTTTTVTPTAAAQITATTTAATTTPAATTATTSPTSPQQKPKQKLRVLCFGDSLTSGYTRFGLESHPYSTTLSTALSRAFPALEIQAIVDGQPGDLVSGVTSRFLARIEPRFLARSGGTPFDWTIILGGTNDLGYGKKPEDVYGALKECWAVALSKGSKVLALTVPEAGSAETSGWKGMCAKRDGLNRLIKEHRQENLYVFDLKEAMPLFDLKPEEADKYWDDGVHMTAAGYGLMGEKIAAAIIDIVMPPGRLQTTNQPRPRKRRREFRDDGHIFEEEEDGALLGRGYVVVRRKDLE